jgi:hypothetical protein
MTKIKTASIVCAAALLVTTIAAAHHGSHGTVTAYEPDAKTVIHWEACAPHRHSYDYVTCGKRLRERVAEMMCQRGEGVHHWLYQISDGRPIPEQTTCR